MAPSKATVLLVDDEEPVRSVVRRILERGGYGVLEADSAGRALEIARRHEGPIHLLVSDIQMPGLTGIELALQIEQERPGIRILLITGNAGTYEAQIRHPVLEKPFTRNDLIIKVDEIFRSRPI